MVIKQNLIFSSHQKAWENITLLNVHHLFFHFLTKVSKIKTFANSLFNWSQQNFRKKKSIGVAKFQNLCFLSDVHISFANYRSGTCNTHLKCRGSPISVCNRSKDCSTDRTNKERDPKNKKAIHQLLAPREEVLPNFSGYNTYDSKIIPFHKVPNPQTVASESLFWAMMFKNGVLDATYVIRRMDFQLIGSSWASCCCFNTFSSSRSALISFIYI